MPHMIMTHEVDPKEAILAELGDISEFKVFHTDIIVAVYLRPEKTKSGLYLPDSHRDEDRHQSKVGLVVAMGPEAFVDESGTWFKDIAVNVGDWVWFRPSDGFNVTINNRLCRAIKDTSVRGVIPHPDMVW
ncbi:MAG: co-chaperone GroES [Patescibacteria group bacterium]|nr:co-chaperone GroES [Patescibacteria group bacterium]